MVPLRRPRTLWASALSLACLALLLIDPHANAQPTPKRYRVGVFQNLPIVGLNPRGQPRGLYVALLKAFANEHPELSFEFVSGTWSENLGRLESGDIDLMTSIAFTKERARRFDYSKENVLTMWGQVYSQPNSAPATVLDLDSKTVAILNGDINGQAFKRLCQRFDIKCRFEVFETYKDIFAAIQDRKVDAGVTNNVFGYLNEKTFKVQRTPILFNPYALLFASPKNKNAQLLSQLDRTLKRWKADLDSPYHQTVRGIYGESKVTAIPPWLLGSLVLIAGLLLLGLVWTVLLSLKNTWLQREIELRRRVQLDLEQAREQAEAANRAKSAFLANMSHEIRTPMNAILGFTQLLEREPGLNSSQRQYLATIRRSGEHLLSLINDVLNMSKIESGQLTLNSDTFNLHDALEDLHSMFLIRAQEKSLSFKLDRGEAVPRHVVGDEGKLRQILINLLGNAFKFTEEGAIILRARATLGERVRLTFEVEDSGSGIAEADVDKVFRRFEQTERGRREKGGSGLGLALSLNFARMMDGLLKVESELGKGSIFRCEVVLGLPKTPIDDSQRISSKRVRALCGPNRYQVLVAEDQDASRGFLCTMLQRVGFEVLEARDGQEALDCFERHGADLILTDINMPKLGGLDLTQRVRASAKGAEVPIIAITARVFELDQARLDEAGINAILIKPFREEALFAKIKDLLGAKFQYEDDSNDGEPAPESRTPLPEAFKKDLHKAAETGDLARLEELCEEAATINSALAEQIRKHIEDFDFDPLMELAEQGT